MKKIRCFGSESHPLFLSCIAHTPTEIDTDDSSKCQFRNSNVGAVTPRPPEQKENIPEKANTKEVVFLEEEMDAPSSSSHSDSEEEAAPLPPLSPQDMPSVEGENSDDVASNAANQNTLQFINTFTPLNDGNEFYDLEDAARYFSRQNETRVCHLCGNPGHLSRNCPLANTTNVCFFCAQPTHNSRSCPFVVCRRLLFISPLIHRCHKPGHESNACSEKSVPPFCHYCSSRLHQPDVEFLSLLDRRTAQSFHILTISPYFNSCTACAAESRDIWSANRSPLCPRGMEEDVRSAGHQTTRIFNVPVELRTERFTQRRKRMTELVLSVKRW